MKFLEFNNIFSDPRSKLEEELFKFFENNNSMKMHISCLNPHSYMTSLNNELFNESLKRANILLADGIGIKLASRFLYTDKKLNRITGFDLFKIASRLSNKLSLKVFFLGTNLQTLQKIKENFHRDYPKALFVGCYAPEYKESFSEDDINKMAIEINKYTPDLLWIGISSPKQDILASNLINKTNSRLIGCIGAVFDYYSGNIKLPSKNIRRIGLEWIYRAIKEPLRMRQRLINNFRFVSLILHKKINRK